MRITRTLAALTLAILPGVARATDDGGWSTLTPGGRPASTEAFLAGSLGVLRADLPPHDLALAYRQIVVGPLDAATRKLDLDDLARTFEDLAPQKAWFDARLRAVADVPAPP